MFLLQISLLATSFYVDPVNGNINNDGSAGSPWSTIQDLIDNSKIASNKPASYPYTVGEPLNPINAGAPVQPGDTLYCYSGYQGSLYIQGYYNLDNIHVIGLPGSKATFHSVHLRGASHWSFDNITITMEIEETYGGRLFWLDTHGYHGGVHNVVIKNCSIYTKWDAYGWSADDWVSKGAHGINGSYPVQQVKYYNNYIRNVKTGIQVFGDDAIVENNTIENFSVDGIRGNGNRLHFYYNLVMNCYDVDGNHDDLFQSFNTGSDPFTDCHLIGNILIGRSDPNQPVALRGDPQGIGMFDGFYDSWIISNNIVAVNHWHGISVYGGRNCIISNNTLTKQDIDDPLSPWIRVVDGNERPSQNNTVTNNIYFNIVTNEDGQSQENIQLNTATQYAEHFIDWQNNDFRLRSSSSLIDAGTSLGAPSVDADNLPRPQGDSFDIGAFEYCSSPDCEPVICPPNLDLSGIQTSNLSYISGAYITSNQVIQNPAVVDYNATSEINLISGLDVQLGAILHAYIDGCSQ